MYDPPERHAANDRLWSAVRAALGHGPETLSRVDDFWAVWHAPDLLLSQTCGMPFRHRLHDKVTLVAAPDHQLPDTPAGHYYSVIVVRAEDPRSLSELSGAHMAVNDALSQSGWSAPMRRFETAGLRPGQISYSGGHALSARAVAEGRADIAGLDAVTWEILKETQPDLAAQLRVIDRTDASPALPFITLRGGDSAALRAALATGIAALDEADRQALRLFGVVEMQVSDYLAVPDPQSSADELGVSPAEMP